MFLFKTTHYFTLGSGSKVLRPQCLFITAKTFEVANEAAIKKHKADNLELEIVSVDLVGLELIAEIDIIT